MFLEMAWDMFEIIQGLKHFYLTFYDAQSNAASVYFWIQWGNDLNNLAHIKQPWHTWCPSY